MISMVRYFKNSRMAELFDELGVVVTKKNQNAIDEELHFWLSVDYPNQAATWKLIRKRLEEDGDGFKERLREVLARFIVTESESPDK